MRPSPVRNPHCVFRRICLQLVSGLHEDDLVLGLISGGGSALLPLPSAALSLHDKMDLNRALLASGATISEMNCVRRHLSAIKGGRLAAACYPARPPLHAPLCAAVRRRTTVTLRGQGRGGRNVECLLSMALTLDGHPRIHALAGDTDGVDGQEEIAGALLAPDSLARAWARGRKPQDELSNNNGHGFFSALGDSVITGPTLTNVNDFRALLIEGQ